MSYLKRFFKKNTHNFLFKTLAGIGRSLHRLYENRNYDSYSNGELTLIKKLTKINPHVIIDGGANIGKFTNLIYKNIPNSKIFAFEPVQKTFDILSENTINIANKILINKGLFSDNCTKEINIFKSNTHSSIYEIENKNYKPIEKIKIILIKGDDFVKENNINFIDFLKLDLEGAEYDAILGFENMISENKIRLIQFEYGFINITTKKLLIDFYTFFAKHNYLVGKIFPKNIEFREYNFKYEDFLGPNFVAVHKEDRELIKIIGRK